MGTPTELFSNLSLQSPMTQTSFNLEQRAEAIRDVLSTFHRDTLPLEYRPEIFRSIGSEQARRPEFEWTMPGDLEGTLFKWATYKPQGFRFLSQIRSSEDSKLLFRQKVARRLKVEFDAYDLLPETRDDDGEAVILGPQDVLAEIHRIAGRLQALAVAVGTDAYQRRLDEESVGHLLLDAMHQICVRHEDKVARLRRSKRRRTVGGGEEGETSLVSILLRRQDRQPAFMLGVLEGLSDRILGRLHDELDDIRPLLHVCGANDNYQTMFAGLLDRSLQATITPAELADTDDSDED